MHIAFFNRAYYPEISATGQLLTELAEGLAQDHHCEVSVVVGIPQGAVSISGSSPSSRVKIFRANGTTWSKRSLLGRMTNYLTYFVSSWLAGSQLNRPDVVIALTDPPIVGLAAWWTARRHKAKLVIAYQDIFPEVAQLVNGFRNPFVDWCLNQVNRFLIQHADGLVVLGEAMRDRLISEKRAPPEKIIIIPSWADCSAITPGSKDNPFSKANHLSDRFVVMHAGNLGLSQNIEILLEAAYLLRDLPRLLFVLVGDGVRKPFLQAEVIRRELSNVRFIPYQTKKLLSDLLASADCFVVSLKPGLAGYITPSKLYTILAAGRPYVAAVDEQCDVARISRQYGCGLVVPAGDALALSKNIRTLHDQPSLAQQLGAAAREASASFDRSVAVAAYYNLCRSLIEHDTLTITERRS